ncbi:MAG TPA: hypothetical protein VNZ66_03610 [Aeromicrobium sp.]|nr:hypothetical protein [Aeromicrobium sp.]
MSEDRRRSFLGLSWFQVIAGALAAMTSAWIASTLGVAGTIIGAAVGSLVATVTAAFYANTLDRSRTLIVRTDSGTVVEAEVEPGGTVAALDAVREVTGSQIAGAKVVETPRRIHWKTVGVTTVFVLLLTFGAMGTYELITGNSYGTNTDNSKIGNPWGSGSKPTAEPTAEPTEPEPSIAPSTDPTPTDPALTETAPTPTESTPTPTEPLPSESAPAPASS